jgi:16S rRNA processing protein RimM
MDGDAALGEIIEVIEQPHQVLCTILYKGKEAMIPVHEASLLKIDKKKESFMLICQKASWIYSDVDKPNKQQLRF